MTGRLHTAKGVFIAEITFDHSPPSSLTFPKWEWPLPEPATFVPTGSVRFELITAHGQTAIYHQKSGIE